MLKLSSAVNVPAYARSSCSAGGWPRPPLMTMKYGRMTSRPHTPQYTMWLDKKGVAMGNQLLSEWRLPWGSPAWQAIVQVDIGKKEPKTLEEINPHWRTMWWLQVAIQGITDEEVPWHKLAAPLTSGAEGMAMSLAKHLVAAWQWNIRV